MPVQMIAGRYAKLRNGRVVGPIQTADDHSCAASPLYTFYVAGNTYTAHGEVFENSEDENDVVEVLPEGVTFSEAHARPSEATLAVEEWRFHEGCGREVRVPNGFNHAGECRVCLHSRAPVSTAP
jgi:hypothetical protein